LADDVVLQADPLKPPPLVQNSRESDEPLGPDVVAAEVQRGECNVLADPEGRKSKISFLGRYNKKLL